MNLESVVSGITIGQLVGWLLALAAAIVALEKAWSVIEKRRKKHEPPCSERLEMLANDKKHLERIDDMLDELKKNAAEQNKVNGILFRAVFAQINHELSGNDVEKLREVRDDMNDYLAKRG